MKYIDAERLIDKILQLQKEYAQTEVKEGHKVMRAVLGGQCYTLTEVVKIIESLQDEQLESSRGKFVFPNYLYARTMDNKTIDVSYAPQSMDAVEYVKNDPTEQQEVDLEKEIDEIWNPRFNLGWDEYSALSMNHEGFVHIARHFYELGLNTRK